MPREQRMITDENFVYGINSVREKLRAATKDILEILIADSSDRLPLRQLREDAEKLGLRITRVPAKTLDHLVGGQRHQGVLARLQAYEYLEFAKLLEQVSGATVAYRILVLDGLTDPRNFGALLRTAEAVGVRYVVIPKDRSVDVTPVVTKASAGATHHLDISIVTNLRRALIELKEHGYWIVGLDGESEESIYDRVFPDRLVIVLGSEGKGVRPINSRECDFLVSIPMLGKIASLNVSVAGAVFLYELLRQDRMIDKAPAKR
jgi:23S rRNA (guanosine2251-2'-O)-methyltransferase